MARDDSLPLTTELRLDRRLLAVNVALLGGGAGTALAFSLATTPPTQVALAVVGTVLIAGALWLAFGRAAGRFSSAGDHRSATRTAPDGGDAVRER